MVVHELKPLFFTYFLANFTLLGAQEGTTIINTGQPLPPVSNTGPPFSLTQDQHDCKDKHWYYSQAPRVDTRGQLW